MAVNYTYVGSVAPETLTINIAQGTSGLNLTTVTAVSLSVKKPDTSTETTLSASIVSQTATAMTIRRTLVSTDLDISGVYRIMVKLTVPGGTQRAGPTFLEVIKV